MIEAAYTAWHTDTHTGHDSLLLAADTETVTTLNARARTDRILSGHVSAEGIPYGTGPPPASGIGSPPASTPAPDRPHRTPHPQRRHLDRRPPAPWATSTPSPPNL